MNLASVVFREVFDLLGEGGPLVLEFAHSAKLLCREDQGPHGGREEAPPVSEAWDEHCANERVERGGLEVEGQAVLHVPLDVPFVPAGEDDVVVVVVPLRPLAIVHLGLESLAVQACKRHRAFQLGQEIETLTSHVEELLLQKQCVVRGLRTKAVPESHAPSLIPPGGDVVRVRRLVRPLCKLCAKGSARRAQETVQERGHTVSDDEGCEQDDTEFRFVSEEPQGEEPSKRVRGGEVEN